MKTPTAKKKKPHRMSNDSLAEALRAIFRGNEITGKDLTACKRRGYISENGRLSAHGMVKLWHLETLGH